MCKTPLESAILKIIKQEKEKKIVKNIIQEFFSSLNAEDIMDLFGGKEKFVALLIKIIKNLDKKDKVKIINTFVRNVIFDVEVPIDNFRKF